MKYIHPDLVVGEPVPEVVARVDMEAIGAIKKMLRWGYWFVPIYAVISMSLVLVDRRLFVLFWVSVVGLACWAVLSMRLRAALKGYRKDPTCIPVGYGLRYWLMVMAVALSFTLPLMLSFGLTLIVWVLGFYLILFGVFLIVMLLRAREPGQISCLKCSYALAGLTLPVECPECGWFVLQLEDTTDRARVSRAWFGWLGGALCLMGLMLVWGGWFGGGVVYQRLPRSVLLGLAAHDIEAFGEVLVMQLDEQERAGLIDSVIDMKVNGGMLSRFSFEQSDWLAQCYVDGSMSGAQVVRMLEPYFVEDLIVIDAPEIGRVGEAIKIELLGERHRMPGNEMVPMMYFRGYEIGPEGEEDDLHAGSVLGRTLYLITPRGREADWHDHGSGRGSPDFVFTPSEAGVVVVRCRVVVALIHGRTTRTVIDWAKPMEEAFEESPVWYRVIDLEHRIVVEGK